jgi:hypothetical protein
VANEARNSIRRGENSFTCFEVLKAKSFKIQGVEAKLTYAIMGVSVECVYSKTEPVLLSLQGN